MKKILLFLLMLVSAAAISQPANYLNIRSRYNLIAVKTDSGFHVPGYSTIPNYRGGVWTGSGNVGVDTVNHKFYFYSGGSWREAGATYTFTNGLTESGGTVTLTNDTTAFANSFYGTNAVGRRGYRPLSEIMQNIYNTDGTLTGSRTVQLDGNTLDFQGSGAEDFSIQNVGSYYLSKVSGSIILQNTNDSIKLQPFNGNLVIGTLKTTTSTTGKKIMLRDTATGLVQNIDPALLRVVDTSYTTIATFTAGGGFASDTTMCTDSTLFGSFYTGQFDYTVAYIQAVIKGNAGDSIVLKLVYNDTFNVDGTKVNGAGLSLNNRYTGNVFTISTNRTIAANTWVWLKPEAVITGKKPKYISVTLIGYKTYVTP